MPLESKSIAETSVAFLQHLCATYQLSLIIMGETGSAHGDSDRIGHMPCRHGFSRAEPGFANDRAHGGPARRDASLAEAAS